MKKTTMFYQKCKFGQEYVLAKEEQMNKKNIPRRLWSLLTFGLSEMHNIRYYWKCISCNNVKKMRK